METLAGSYRQEGSFPEVWEILYRRGRLFGRAEWGDWEMVPFGANTFRVKAWPGQEYRFDLDQTGKATGFKEYKNQFKVVPSGSNVFIMKAWPDPEFRMEGGKKGQGNSLEKIGQGKVTKVFKKVR